MDWKRLLGFASVLLAWAPTALAQDEIATVKAREQQEYALSCQETRFMPEAFWSGDINKDGLTDVIVQSSAIACDNELGSECDALGCPIRLYVQTDDGLFSYVGQVRGFGYSLRYNYGIRVLAFKIGGNRCAKVNSNRCLMIARVEGRKLVRLSTE